MVILLSICVIRAQRTCIFCEIRSLVSRGRQRKLQQMSTERFKYFKREICYQFVE